MKEIMYSGVDSITGQQALAWTRGDEMRVSTDTGNDDPWRDCKNYQCKNFKVSYGIALELDLTRFTGLTVVWERG